MEKSTKLIIAAIGLGSLGYFLYKKGLFKTTTNEVAKDVKKVDDVVKDVVKEVVDTGKKTAVEPTKPCEVIKWNCGNNPRETIQIPYDANCNDYQYEKPPCAPPYDPIGFRDNTYNDQLYRIDDTSGKYNQEVSDFYMGRDLDFIRNNRELFM
jgi:hypothetical protein